MLEIILIAIIFLFIITYRKNNGKDVYKYIGDNIAKNQNKYNPYSFKEVREKTKKLGQEYTLRQYVMQIILFSLIAGGIGYLYFYNLVVVIVYAAVAISVIPFLAYIRCKRIYSEFIFEQMQVYSTNVIMEFNTTQSFVKSLEGVRDSGVLEEPVLSDVKTMIDLSYKNGTIDESIDFFNSKYDYYIIKNLHQLFIQITKEGSQDTTEALENMLLDIDMLVESVYRDRLDRQEFHKRFIIFGLALYLLIMLIQLLLGKDTYVGMLDQVFILILLHAVVIINSLFMLNGEKYYNEDVGAE